MNLSRPKNKQKFIEQQYLFKISHQNVTTKNRSMNHLAMAANGVHGAPVVTPRKAPRNLREAIEAGDVLAVASMVRAMSQEEAAVELVAQDR